MRKMTSSGLEAIPADAEVFLDATIFIYHFTGVSTECRRLLERCDNQEIKGVTSVTALAEVSHRLMMMEAVSRALISPSNVARKLRERPGIVRQLSTYRTQLEAIPLMGIEVLDADLATLRRALTFQRNYGLLTNDSILVATALEKSIATLATGDRDFERVPELAVHRPQDLE